MRNEPKCPECGWRLEFIPDFVYPEYNEWIAKCYNVFCPVGYELRPSDCGWTEPKMRKFSKEWLEDRERRRKR